MKTERAVVPYEAPARPGLGERLKPAQLAEYQPNWLLIPLPTVLALSISAPKATAYLVVWIGVASFWRKPAARDSTATRLELTWGVAAFLLLALSIMLRPNMLITASTAAIYVVEAAVFIRIICISASKSSAFLSLMDGLGAFLVVSVALTLAGVTGTYSRTAGLDNELTGGKRIVFALSPNLAATPDAAGVYLAAAIPILIAVRRFRAWRLVAVACAAYIRMAAGVRMAILAGVAVALMAYLFPRILRVIAPWLIVFMLSIPFLVRSALESFLSALALVSPDLYRAAGTLLSRTVVWDKALSYHSVWVDWKDQMLGAGSFGHVKTGAPLSYTTQENFIGLSDRHLVTPHNSSLMVLFDAGWVGLIVFIATLGFAAYRLAMSPSLVGVASVSALVALCLVGVTEAGLTPETNLTIWWMLLGFVTIAFCREVPIDKAPLRRNVSSPSP